MLECLGAVLLSIAVAVTKNSPPEECGSMLVGGLQVGGIAKTRQSPGSISDLCCFGLLLGLLFSFFVDFFFCFKARTRACLIGVLIGNTCL